VQTPDDASTWCTFRATLRLRADCSREKLSVHFTRSGRPVKIIRFKETINGRTYLIEAQPLDPHRWRAQLVRATGRTTALMPFYGETPDEAVRHLSGWLARTGLRTH